MLRDRVFLFSLFVLLLLATVHHIGLALDWYYTMPSLDFVTHFLGGFWVVVTSLWFVFRSGYMKTAGFSKKKAALVAFGTIVAVGVIWELFELWAGIIIREGYALDTILDGVMDILGAFAGLSFFTTLNNS